MRMRAYQGSHLPVLIKLVSMTDGPILELGSGMFSSCFLHWACYPTKRRIVTYENFPNYYSFVNMFKADFHEVHCITDWDSIDISEPWNIAFVDHEPPERKGIETRRLAHSDYIVAHDVGHGRRSWQFGYKGIYDEFKYHFDYDTVFPATAVFSNKHDLKEFTIP